MDFFSRCSGCLRCSDTTGKSSCDAKCRRNKRDPIGDEETTQTTQIAPSHECSEANSIDIYPSSTQQPRKQSTCKKMNNPPQPPKLSSFTLEGIADLIRNQRIDKESVIVLVGAGMSTAAGVPDFRSPNTGIYASIQKYNLPHPEDAFNIDCFKNKPEIFYEISKSILPTRLYPTLAHYFVRLLHEKGYLLRCYSQNVDGLEALTGLARDKFCLAHGSFETGHCLRCNAEYSLAWMRAVVADGGIPHCNKTKDCRGLVKPDIKFFGERLDSKFFRLVKEDFGDKCQLLIILGTSLKVMPFARLVQKVPEDCPRLLINKTKSGHEIPLLMRIFTQSDGLLYGRSNNKRDVAFIGDCDEGCLKLAQLLGWNEELQELAATRRRELEQDYPKQ